MTAFLSGALFGFLFAGSLFAVFVTRKRQPEREIEPWADPFEAPPPAPVVIHTKLIQKREIQI